MEHKSSTYSSRQLIAVAEVATALALGRDIAGLEAMQALAKAVERGELSSDLYPPHQKWAHGGPATSGQTVSNSHQVWRNLAIKSRERHTSDKADFDYPSSASTYHLLANDLFTYANSEVLSKHAAESLRNLAIRYNKELASDGARVPPADTLAPVTKIAPGDAPINALKSDTQHQTGTLAAALVVEAQASETPKQRRARLLDWYDKGERGAVRRVYERERLQNPKADRSNIGKQIKKARAEHVDTKRGLAWVSHLVKDGKR